MDRSLESEGDRSFEEYKRSVRGRASETYSELRQNLERSPMVSPSRRRGRHSSPGSSNVEHTDYTYGAAVERLKGMLNKQDSRNTTQKIFRDYAIHTSAPYQNSSPEVYRQYTMTARVPPPPPGPRGQLPTPEETVPLLQNQTALIHQLEAENRYCKEEVHVLKQKIREVMEENRILHEELKGTVIQEILQQGIDVPGIPSNLAEGFPKGTSDHPTMTEEGRLPTKVDYTKWRTELERINALHTTKVTRLETQLAFAREERDKFESESEDYKSRLRMVESMGAVEHDGIHLSTGLCIRCGQNEAVLPSTIANQQAALSRITKERDELMDKFTNMKARLEELKVREEDAYVQVKKSVEMVEQAQLEQTQALVQREQLKEELENMRIRMAEHAEEMTQKMSEERQIIRKEYSNERDELNLKIKELTELLVNTQNQYEKVTRDRVGLLNELEGARGQITVWDTDYNKATDSMKMTLTTSAIERDAAMREMHRMKNEMETMEKDFDQQRHRLKSELTDVKRRLEQAETELINAKEECIHLTTHTQALEREVHVAKMAREAVEKNRSDDVKSITRRAENRENELNMLLDKLEAKHENSAREMDELFTAQSKLLQRLKEECRQLTKQLENITTKYKGDNKRLKQENSQMKLRLEKLTRRLRELEDTSVQHGQLQEKMRERLRNLDDHGRYSSQQLLELLAKESCLMRDRALLAREVEYLRNEVLTTKDSDLDKLYSTRQDVIEDILANVKNELDHTHDKKHVDFLSTDIPQTTWNTGSVPGTFGQGTEFPLSARTDTAMTPRSARSAISIERLGDDGEPL